MTLKAELEALRAEIAKLREEVAMLRGAIFPTPVPYGPFMVPPTTNPYYTPPGWPYATCGGSALQEATVGMSWNGIG